MNDDYYVSVFYVYDRTNIPDRGNRLKTFQEGKLIGKFLNESTALARLYDYKYKNNNAKMEILTTSIPFIDVPFIQMEVHTLRQFRTNV